MCTPGHEKDTPGNKKGCHQPDVMRNGWFGYPWGTQVSSVTGYLLAHSDVLQRGRAQERDSVDSRPVSWVSSGLQVQASISRDSINGSGKKGKILSKELLACLSMNLKLSYNAHSFEYFFRNVKNILMMISFWKMPKNLLQGPKRDLKVIDSTNWYL